MLETEEPGEEEPALEKRGGLLGVDYGEDEKTVHGAIVLEVDVVDNEQPR